MPDPVPGPGEVRLRIAVSGVNPGDVKKRQNAFGYGMPYPRVIPHSDGAGIVERVGEGVPSEWVAGRAGANEVVVAGPDLIERVQALAPHGVDHIVEVALGANVGIDLEVLALGGSIATYATDAPLR